MLSKLITLSFFTALFQICSPESINSHPRRTDTLNSIFNNPSDNLDEISRINSKSSEKNKRDLLGTTQCPTGCTECTSSSYNSCTKCANWYFALDGECLSVCPDGFSYGESCVKWSSSLIFDIDFKDIRGYFQVSSYTNTNLICGNDPYHFYPNYDANDPFPTKDRGYYFDVSTSYMQMPPNSLSLLGFRPNLNHTFSIWAYQLSTNDQSLFQKFDSQGNKIWAIRTVSGYIYYEWTHLNSNTNDLTSYSYATGGSQVWNSYVFTFSKVNGAFTSSFYMNNQFVDTNTLDSDDKFIWDDEGSFCIGYYKDPNTGGESGWDGFIAKISYYTDTLTASDISALYGTCTNTCSSLCTSSGDCFSTCDVQHYADSPGSCSGECQSSCSHPCVYSDRCTLCYDSSVTTCYGFDDGEQLSYSCYKNCATCGDSNFFNCLSCNSGFYLHYDTCVSACPTSYTETAEGCTGSGNNVYDFVLNEISGSVSDSYGYFSLVSGSDSSKFYPDPDSSDAIPAFQRGYYFDGVSSYMKLNDQIIFNYYQTHGFWLKNEGGSYTQTILSAVDADNNYVLKIELTGTTISLTFLQNSDPANSQAYVYSSSASLFDIPKHSWTFLTIRITLTNGNTWWKAYNFNLMSFINSIGSGAAQPALPAFVTFGADKTSSATSNYFKGFIYEILYLSEAASSYKISQLFSVSCSGCDYCVKSSNLCLGACGIHHYAYYGTCLPCKSTCKYGCVKDVTCNLCDDSGCFKCSIYESETCTQCYTDASVSSDSCACSSGTANLDDLSGTCVECSNYCSKCSWPYMVQCSSCPSGRYLTSEGICTPYCPYGCGDSTRQSTIVDYVFTTISNNQTDSANQIILYLGSTDNYYRYYDDNDPEILPYRGLYFNGTSYAQFLPNQYNDSQLYLGYSHTVDLWLFPLQYSGGSIMSKYFSSSDIMYTKIVESGSDTYYQICYHLISVDNGNWDNLCSTAAITSTSVWAKLTWTLSFSSPDTSLSAYLDGTHMDTQTFTDDFIFDEDLYFNFVLGYSSSLSYYVGYIYSLRIYNYVLGAINPGSTNCGCQYCTDSDECLSTCLHNEAYIKESNTCESCPDGCGTGCKDSSACSICNNYLCSSCSNFNPDGCRVCTTNAQGYINADNISDCKCYDGYYGNPASLICESCFSKCSTCTGAYANKCTGCNNNWFLLPEGICVKSCPLGYSDDGNYNCKIINPTSIIDFKFDVLSNTQTEGDANTVGIYYGNSSDFYPNYDSYDPWVLKERGLYFSGNSYATYLKVDNTSPFYFGLNHTFDMWVMPRSYNGDSMIYSKYSSGRDLVTLQVHGSTSGYYLSICYDFISVVDGSTSTVKCISSGSYEFSVWKRISWSICYTSSYSSSLSLYVDSTLLDSSTVSSSYFDENVDFTINIGSKATSSYFTGYLYSLYYYNYAVTSFDQGQNTCGCAACDNLNNCLATCTENEYFSEGSCQSCEGGCSGCVTGSSCNMCDDQLCSTCTSLEALTCTACTDNAEFNSSNICVCSDNYGPNNGACSPCDSSCKTCSGINMYQCKSCYSNYYLTLEGICSSYCAFGCSDSNRNSVIVDFKFTKISNDLQDTTNLIDLFLGSTTAYYPNYDSEDPKILEYRGLYFNGSSIAKLPPNSYNSSQLYLGFSHAIDTWVFTSPDLESIGYLIGKWSSSNSIVAVGIGLINSTPQIVACYELMTLDHSGTTNACAFTETTFGEWHRYSWSLGFKNGESNLILYLDGSAISPQVVAAYNYEDYTDAVFELGVYSQNYFIGYVYSLTVYNYPKADFSSSTSGCGCQACTDSNDCLSSCGISQLYDKNEDKCESCLSGCQSIGCVAADRCGICFDPICKECTSFENGSCTSCRDNAAFDNSRMCQCNSRLYWNLSSESCEACGTLCYSCSDEHNCISCLDSNTMSVDSQNLGNCKCNGYAYFDGNRCETCGDLCVSCNSTGCLECADTSKMQFNSADSNHSCVCNDGLYYNTTLSSCEKCISPCSSCKNETFCLSCLDSTMSLSQGTCSCSSSQYFNYTNSLCKSCINQCLTCESETSCTSCVDHADLIGKSCDCKDSYTPYNNSCAPCSDCLTCSGTEIYQCLSCATDEYLTAEGICSSYCAYGCNDATRHSIIVNYTFTSISNTQYDSANSIELILGNSSSYYPSYDYHDPKILPYRGLYFNQSSYASVSSASGQLYLGYSHTADLWAYVSEITDFNVIASSIRNDKNSNFLAAVLLSGSDTLFTSCYYLSNFTKTGTSLLCSNNTVNTNSWCRFTWTLKFSNGETTLALYLNSASKGQETLLGYFYDESDYTTFYLGGSPPYYYFKGYIYSLTIYNYVLAALQIGSNDCGCQACSDLNQCLSTCSASEAYKLESNACESCPYNCQNGCLTASYCGICEDSLCLMCSDFSNSCTTCVSNADFNSSHICECGSEYFKSADLVSCGACNKMCVGCNGQEANKCKECIHGSYMTTDGFCVFNCQLGYTSTDGITCSAVNQNSLMVYFIFNQLANTQLDTVSSLPIFFGSNSSFYPSYDENDPRVLKNRGLFFNGRSYAILFYDGANTSPVSFGFSHTLEIWLLVLPLTDDGIVISKYSPDSALFLLKIKAQSQSYSLSLCYNFTDINDSTSTNYACVSSQSYHDYNQWTKISWIMESSSDYGCQLLLYLLSELDNSAVVSNSYFDENSVADVRIGSMGIGSFFKGYIYSLRIHNYAIGHINGASSGCGCSKCTEYGDCLADCAYSEYYASGMCASCLSTCTNGCVSENTCNLCDDPICSNCTSLESGTCVSCKSDSSFDSNSHCLCNDRYYWNSTTESCALCGNFCESCTSSDHCQYCVSNDTMVINQSNPGSCKCNDKAYYNSTWCFNCGDLCKVCNETDCHQCNDTSTMHIDPNNELSCLCNDGFYYNSSTYTCELCGDKCAICSSSANCSQCTEPDKMIISEKNPGACECDVGWIIDGNSCSKCQDSEYSNKTECIECEQPCSSCLNATYCLTCLDETMSLDSGICSCSDGEYFNSSSLSCQPCKNRCLTCTSETNCTSCISNANAINDNACACTSGFYPFEDGCFECSSSCFNCSGPSMHQCTSCSQNTYLTSERICSDYCAYDCQEMARNSIILNFTFINISNQQTDSANQIPLYMGNDDSYYPDYDLNDPKIIPYRGLYFNGSSRALLPPNSYNSSQLYLGFSHTIDIWTYISDKSIENGILMAKYYSDDYLIKAEFLANDGMINVCYNLHALDLSSVNDACLNTSISTNNWLRLTWTLQFKSGNTSMSLFSNGVLINNLVASESYFYEAFSSTFALGDYDSSSYFYGYIYSLKIYNYELASISMGNSNCGCQHCTDLDQCLSTCSYDEAYNTTLGACESCPSSCENGCTHSWACTLCDSFLCSSCHGYSPTDCSSCVEFAHFNGNACECDANYRTIVSSMKCVLCTDYCDNCYDYAANQCVDCISSYYLTNEGFCVINCPLGYSYNGTMCISEDADSLAVSYKFGQLMNTQKDSVSQVPIEFGSSSNFYPHYDENDPIVLQYRGLYFEGNQYANLPPNSAESSQMVFGFSHTVDMWIMPMSGNATFLSKYTSTHYLLLAEVFGSNTYSLSISHRLTSISDGVVANYKNITSDGHSYLEWKRVSFSLNYNSETTRLSLFINGNLEVIDSSAGMFFDENALALINLGSYNLSSYYTGYIYSLKIYNYALDSFSQGTCDCTACTEDNDCLVDCAKENFYTSNTCQLCLSTCTNGCISGNRCNLCSDPLCDTCSSFRENDCSACISNAVFDMVTDLCECDAGYIFNSSSETCVTCSSLCKTCEGMFDNCTSCHEGYYMNPGGLCIMNCSLGYSVVDNNCHSDSPDSMVAYFLFNELSNTIYDSVSNLAIYMGSNDSYYPNYDINDPWTLPYRGIYFSGNSTALLQPNDVSSAEIILGLSHSIELWIMPISNSSYETVISKYTPSLVLIKLQLKQSESNYNINACYTLLDTNTSSIAETLCVSSTHYNYNTWKQVTISLSYESGSTRLTLYIGSESVGLSSISNFFYYENYVTSFILGTLNSDAYFTGYIYSLKLYNYAMGAVKTGSSSCNCQACTDDNDCLITCGAREYYDSSSKACKTCQSDCSNGCARGTDCSLHPDETCKTYTTLKSGSCTECVQNAINVPPCTCYQHSLYSSNLRECSCIENYQAYNSTCMYCYKYIQSSEITASFSSTFLKIVLAFPVSLNTTGVTCSSLFPADVLEKFGSGYSCSFNTDATAFTIELGSNFTLKDESIGLNSGILKQSNKTECGYFPTNLETKLSYTASFPSPSAKIDAPASVLYSCQNLTISGYKSTGSVNQLLYYKWEISSNPYSSKLSKYNTGFQTEISQFTVPQSDLSDTTITITLTVRNYFSLIDTSSTTVKSSYSGIVVTFDKTVDYELLATDYTTYAIGVISSCEAVNKFSIAWTIDSVSGNSSAINEEYFWESQTSSSFIIIPKRAFPPNINVVFRADVADSINGIEGSGFLSLVVNPAEPVVKVSRSSGNFGISDNLAINANSSYDPNEYKALNYEWSCTYASGSDCSSLIQDRTAENLDVPQGRLVSGVEYSFTLTVYRNYGRLLKESRLLTQTKAQSSSTILVSAVDYSTPTVNIVEMITGNQPSIVLPNQQLTLYAEVSDPTKYSFEWTYDGEASVAFGSSLDTPYLIIAQDSMEPGRSYTFSLSLNDGSHISSYQYKFYTNSAPYAGTFSVSPSSGVESKTVFKMEALGWVDDESNTPFTYSYGYLNAGDSVYMNSKNQTSTYYSMFPYISKKLATFVEVYDSLGSFTRSTYVIAVSIDKNLDQSQLYDNIANEIASATANPQAFPGLISRLAISTLNRDAVTDGTYSNPSSDQLKLLQSILSSALDWTNSGLNSMALMDSQSVTTYTNLLLTLTANPYLNSTSTQSAVCDMIDSIVSKLDTSVPLSDSQSEGLFTVIDQAYKFSASSLVNDTSSLDTALSTINNIQSVMTSQMAVGETKSFSVGNIEVNAAVMAVASLNGYDMESSEGNSKVALPDNFAGAIASITTSSNVGLNMNILSPSNDYSSLSSSIVDFSVFDKESKSSIHTTLSSNISVQIPSYNLKYSNYTPQCVYLDTTSGNWSTKGCSTGQLTSSYMACSCNHFTSFSIKNAAVGTLVNSNIGDTINVSAFSNINSTNAAGLYFCVGTLTAYGILACYSIKKDRQDEREEDAERTKKKGTPVKVSRFTKDIQDNHDPSRFELVLGRSGSYTESCDTLERKDQDKFSEEDSLSFVTPKEVYVYQLEKSEYSRKNNFTRESAAPEKKWQQQFKEKHELLNIIFIKDLSRSRLSRATLFFFALLGQMFFTGLFYKDDSSDSTVTVYNSTNSSGAANSTTTSDDSDSAGSVQYKLNDFFISIYSVLIMLTIIIVLTLIMNEKAPTDSMTEATYRQTKKRNKIKRFVGNGVAWGVMLYFCWSIVLFSIQFDEQVSKTWVLNSAVSYAIKIFVTSWVKGAIVAYLTLQYAKLLKKFAQKQKENEEIESNHGDEQKLDDYKEQIYGVPENTKEKEKETDQGLV